MFRLFFKIIIFTIAMHCLSSNVCANGSDHLKVYYQIANLKFNNNLLLKTNPYKTIRFYELNQGKDLDSVILGIPLGKKFEYSNSSNIFYKRKYLNYIMYDAKPLIDPKANNLKYLRVVVDKHNIVKAVICYIWDPTGETLIEDCGYKETFLGNAVVEKDKDMLYWENKKIFENMGNWKHNKKIIYIGIWLKTEL